MRPLFNIRQEDICKVDSFRANEALLLAAEDRSRFAGNGGLDAIYTEMRDELVDAAVNLQIGFRTGEEVKRVRASVAGYASVLGACVAMDLPQTSSESEMGDILINDTSDKVQDEVESIFDDIFEKALGSSLVRSEAEKLRVSKMRKFGAKAVILGLAAGSSKASFALSESMLPESESGRVAGGVVGTLATVLVIYGGKQMLATYARNKTHSALDRRLELLTRPIDGDVAEHYDEMITVHLSANKAKPTVSERAKMIGRAETLAEGHVVHGILMSTISEWQYGRDSFVPATSLEAGHVVSRAVTKHFGRSWSVGNIHNGRK